MIVIPCTERKRFPPDAELRARVLPEGDLSEVAAAWSQRVFSAAPVGAARDVYCGRAFREAFLAVQEMNADLVIVSAGLGLVEVDQQIPSYGLTVVGGRQDSVGRKIVGPVWCPADWWDALRANSPFTSNLKQRIEEAEASVVLMSLSESYGRMVWRDLEALSGPQVERLRIFGANIARHLPENVSDAVMPYDRAFDGSDSPIPGTMSDFGSRVLHHYCQLLSAGEVGGESAKEDGERLAKHMSSWSPPDVPKRKKLTDREVLDFISENWSATGGRSQASLRFLRDSGFACEQGRFKDLFHRARALRDREDTEA